MFDSAAMLRRSCGIALACAIGCGPAAAHDPLCAAPARFEGAAFDSVPMALRDYRPVFQQCRNAQDVTRLAIRRMGAGGDGFLLTVDPATLSTSLEHDRCWTCADTSEEAQKDTRFARAALASAQSQGRALPQRSPALRNAGLIHGAGAGSYVTGDLCPARGPLDRSFVETLKQAGPHTPVALSISGLWLKHHGGDFQWLRAQAAGGALDITWVNHSFHHPWIPGHPLESNFLLTPGTDINAEILDTERLLIANGATPSVFFRFPGLISDAALTQSVRRLHLITLGADSWLIFAPVLRDGAIVLVHPNGNENAGLRLFSKLFDKGAFPRPFRPITDAP